MSHITQQRGLCQRAVVLLIAVAVAGFTAIGVAQQGSGGAPSAPSVQSPQPVSSAMNDPYRLVAGWPSMPPNITWGQAIGLVPDGTGGLWLQQRSEPPVLHFNAAGHVVASFGQGTFVQAHGLCRDRSG